MALKQLRPREASRIDDSLASPPVDARKKKSLTERIKGAISGRQFSVAAIIPGTGRTVNRPLRAGLPADAATEEDAIMEEARLVSSVAESLAESIGRPEAALWKRPAPSKAYRMMTKVIPWMKPAPLPEISTIHGHRASAARAYQAYGAPARGRAEISEGAKKLLGQIDEKRKALDEAVGKFNAAHAAREHGRSAASGSAQTRELAEQRALAAREVRAASSALHETISGADLVGLKGLSYLADMLKEISANREQWLMRCVETLEPDAHGNTDTPDNRMRAGVLLDEFEQEIQRLGKNSKYCLYNVNYSMRGAASEWIDGYRGLAQLARKRGDAQAERRAQEAIDEILVNRGTWRPLMLIVRERAKDSTTIGWRNLLRWQRMHNVDGQRTAAQFPPP